MSSKKKEEIIIIYDTDDEKKDTETPKIKLNYVYLIHLREFIEKNDTVYKIGRTCQERTKRFNQYPKGSILLFQSICKDCINVEKEIIKFFKIKYKQRTDFGTEYFEGDYVSMIEDINLIIKSELDNSKYDIEMS